MKMSGEHELNDMYRKGIYIKKESKKLTLLFIPVGKFFSAFDPSLVIKQGEGSVPCSRTL